jgi:hypothetical protein
MFPQTMPCHLLQRAVRALPLRVSLPAAGPHCQRRGPLQGGLAQQEGRPHHQSRQVRASPIATPLKRPLIL